MNRRWALSILLLSPVVASGAVTWAAAGERTATAKNNLLRSDIGMAINNANASGWSASMSDVDLLPTFVSSPQRTQSPEMTLKK
jgi:hypothetical protein